MLPPHLKESLDRYVSDRVPTGGFLEAVLSNDLSEAVGRADEVSTIYLKEIVQYIYNELPSCCWGSPDKVSKWLREGEQANGTTSL